MKIKKTASIFLVSSALLGVGVVAPNLMQVNAQTIQSPQNSGQGEIIVHYVDQNGNVIQPATTAMGKTGSTYVASIPNIPGYKYSSIENGQNDSNGPQMTFGGDDPSTDIMEMSIVYKSTGNSSNNNGSSSTNGNKGTNATPSKSGNSKNSSSNNNSSSNTNKSNSSNTPSGTNSSNNTKSSTNKKSNNGTTSSSETKNSSNNKDENEANNDNTNKTNNDEKNNKSDSNVNKTKNKKSDKNKDQNKVDDDNKKDDSTKNKDKKKSHKSIVPWVVSGIILVVVAGAAFAWHEFRKPRHFEH